jgi:signal transduction histidine kinase
MSKVKNGNKIENRLRLILSVAVFLLIILSTISYRSLNSFKAKNEWVAHSTEVLYNLQSMVVELKEAENNSQAFLITQDNSFRKPSINSKIGVMEYFDESKKLTEDNKRQQRRFEQLEQLINKWYVIIENIQEQSAQSRLTDAEVRQVMLREAEVMESIQSVVSLLEETEKKLLSDRNIEVEIALEENYIMISIFAALTLIIIILAYLNFMNDIQVRKSLEEKLQDSVHQLSQSNKELEQFAYVASHDLQEPLRKVVSFSDIILRKHIDGLDEKGKAYFQRMVASTERMQTLIQDLLNFSRTTRNVGDKKPVDINKLIKEVLEDLSQAVKDTGGKVKLKLQNNAIVTGTPVQLRQLIQNIVSNAIKYQKKNEQPIIKIKSKEIEGEKLLKFLPIVVSDRFLEIIITDNGIGFDEQYLDKIFTIFQRLHGRSEYTGTGIGLALCKRVVDNHHGYITAKSESGKGSTFFIYLPLDEA